jgi:hypothetical protein
MTDEDGFRLEAAEQFGASSDCYTFTEAQLIAFAKACERAGMAQAHAMGSRDTVWKRMQEIDAELAPILAEEEARFMTAQGYVRATDDQPGARWIKPEPPLCEDEGCPHHGTSHVCTTRSAAIEECAGLMRRWADDAAEFKDGRASIQHNVCRNAAVAMGRLGVTREDAT